MNWKIPVKWLEAPDIKIDEYLSDDEIPDYRLRTNNYSSDDEEPKVPYAQGESFTQYLKSQLSAFPLDEQQRKIAEFLIGSINDNGYLRREITRKLSMIWLLRIT